MSPRRTRASNSSKRPGLLVKPATRRTSADVKAAAEVKAAANAAKKQAKEARIKRVAEFESNAQDHEDLIDATPRPNLTRRDSVPDSDIPGTSEDDGPNPDKHTYTPPDESDDADESEYFAEEVPPIPKRKKVTPAVALATIAENSEDNLEPPASKTPWIPSGWGQIMEETDSDGVDPPLKHWKPKARAHAAETDAESEPEAPPSKKTKVVKDVEQELMGRVGKKKESVREAITASIQESRMAVSTDSNGGRVSEKVQVAVNKVKNPLKIVSKRFGNGPQWNRQGREQEVSEKGDRSINKRPNQNNRGDVTTYVIDSS